MKEKQAGQKSSSQRITETDRFLRSIGVQEIRPPREAAEKDVRAAIEKHEDALRTVVSKLTEFA